MELEHINLKIYLDSQSSSFPVSLVIPVFHSWIQNNALDELLIDVADYAHVPAGPGILLIGHDAFYSLEHGSENQLGLLYNRRTKLSGMTNQERFCLAIERLFKAKTLLENEKSLSGKLSFSIKELKVIINDRYLAPNEKSTYDIMKNDLAEALYNSFGHRNFQLHYDETSNPRFRFEVLARDSAA